MVWSRGVFNLRASLKGFLRAPLLTFALLFTIALGVGSNIAIYGYILAVIRPGALSGPTDPLVSIFRHDRLGDEGLLSVHDVQVLKSRVDLFDWIGAARISPDNITVGGHTEIATVAFVTPNLADEFQLRPGPGVLISHHMWQHDFEGRAEIIRSPIRINNVDLLISGVAPEKLDGLYSDRRVDVWALWQGGSLEANHPGSRDVWAFARLRPGVSTSQVQDAVLRSLPDSKTVSVIPYTGLAPGMVKGLARINLVLNFAAGAILFIACTNVASFLLGRALKRLHETALRVALGATRANLTGELLSDSIVISIAGGLGGLVLAFCTARMIPALLFEEDAEHLVFSLPLVSIVLSTFLCVGTIIACGMAPALSIGRHSPAVILQRESALPSKITQRLRSCIVVGQTATCYVLLICSATLLVGLKSALKTSAGHRLGNPLLITVEAAPDGDFSYFKKVEQTAGAVTHRRPLAWTNQLPGTRPTWQSFRVLPPATRFRDMTIDMAWLTPEWLSRIDKWPTAGRLFNNASDLGRRVAVIDEEAAAELYGPDTAGMVLLDSSGLPVEIIGIVRKHVPDVAWQKRPTIFFNPAGAEPSGGSTSAHFRVPVVASVSNTALGSVFVSPGYFKALGVPLTAGRPFPEHPVAGMGRVAIINQEAADVYFGGKPLGRAIIDEGGARAEVIGVVGSQSFGTFQAHTEPTVYFPMYQDYPLRMTLMLEEPRLDRRGLAELANRIESVPGRGARPIVVKTLDAQLAQSAFAPLRIATIIGASSASIALILGILGIFGASSDAERQSRRELGLHVALGAQRWRIFFKVLKHAGILACMGIMAGASVSAEFLRAMLRQLPDITSPPLWLWFAVALLSMAAVIIASLIPAVRASMAEPMTIMRDNG